MKDEKGSVRTVYLRPILLAAMFIAVGQGVTYVKWGTIWTPDYDNSATWFWSAFISALAALAVGLMTGLVAGRRYDGAIAAGIAACCYATVLIAALLICFELDYSLELFEIRYEAKSFIIGSLFAVLASAPLFGWLLHSRAGKALLTRIGL